jgi:hypothetical protein
MWDSVLNKTGYSQKTNKNYLMRNIDLRHLLIEHKTFNHLANKLKRLLYMLAMLAPAALNAQPTMMNEVSQPYLQKLISTARQNFPKYRYTTARMDAAKANYQKTKLGVFDFASLSYVYYPNNVYTF